MTLDPLFSYNYEIAVDNFVQHFSPGKHSYKSAIAKVELCMIKDNISANAAMAFGDQDLIRDASKWFISHKYENISNLNLYGGFEQEQRDYMERILEKGADNLVSINYSLDNEKLFKLLRYYGRRSPALDFTPSQWDQIIDTMRHVPVMSYKDLVPNFDTVILGDSHVLSVYRTGSVLIKKDGQTLFGLLRNGIRSYLAAEGIEKTKHLILQAGNIDIRHHLLRQDDPEASVTGMVSDLVRQVSELLADGTIKAFSVVEPFPIEFEGRSLPKSVTYKDTPFYGSREQRDAIRRYLVGLLRDHFETIRWPADWYTLDPEIYAANYMEKPQSIHLSPQFFKWDLELNRVRKEKEEKE